MLAACLVENLVAVEEAGRYLLNDTVKTGVGGLDQRATVKGANASRAGAAGGTIYVVVDTVEG